MAVHANVRVWVSPTGGTMTTDPDEIGSVEERETIDEDIVLSDEREFIETDTAKLTRAPLLKLAWRVVLSAFQAPLTPKTVNLVTGEVLPKE